MYIALYIALENLKKLFHSLAYFTVAQFLSLSDCTQKDDNIFLILSYILPQLKWKAYYM